MKILGTLFFLIALAVSTTANACDERRSIVAGGWSHHFIDSKRKGDEDWNEKHDIIGIECNKWSFVYFNNSWGNNQVGVGYDAFQKSFLAVDASLYVAAWSGYQEIVPDIGVIPVVSPKIRITVYKVEVTTLINPVVSAVYIGYKF